MNDPPRIIHCLLTRRDDRTGVYTSVRALAMAQRALGADVHIVGLDRWPDDDIRDHGVPVHEGGLARCIGRVRALAERECVLHGHTVWRGIALAPMLLGDKRAHVTALMSPHNSLSDAAMGFKSARKALAWRLVFRRAVAAHDAIVATSDQEAAEVAARVPDRPVMLLPNAVASAPPGTLAGVARGATVGYIGRIHPIKGVTELAQAWASLAPAGWRLRIVGPVDDEGYARALRAITARCESITIEPALYGPDKWRFLAACALIAVPSRIENFGNVIAEAYRAGTPVLTTLGAPWPEIEWRGMGWRGDGSAEGLAAMLKDALAVHPAERARMGRIGQHFVESAFGGEAVAARSLELYQTASHGR